MSAPRQPTPIPLYPPSATYPPTLAIPITSIYMSIVHQVCIITLCLGTLSRYIVITIS